jgi:hypothetical protein
MKYKILFSILVLMLASLACSIFIGGPEYPTQTIPVSTGDVPAMQTQMAQAFLDGAQSGVVTLTITESQLTSLIAAKIEAQENPPFTNPQIYLRDNQLHLYGTITRGSFTANMLVAASVGIDPVTGLPKVEIVSADFGPFEAPEGLNSTVSAVVAEAFTGSLGPVATGFRLESITIADGVMTLVGRIK